MTNREYLAFAIAFTEYADSEVADIISDFLMEITDDEDTSIAVICGKDKELLTEWLGKEADT
jgi:hypothetical protein